MKVVLLLLSAVLVAGCASHRPRFQKAAPGGDGYVITNLSPTSFKVQVDLPSKADDKFKMLYGQRAVGEECLRRGYPYFDAAVLELIDIEGYCYKTADHPALAVEFAERGLAARPQKFIVGDLHGKTKTTLEKGDEVLAIDGVTPAGVGTFKSVVYKASSAGRTSVQLKIRRGDSESETKEPIALFKNSGMGSTQLDLMRSAVP